MVGVQLNEARSMLPAMSVSHRNINVPADGRRFHDAIDAFEPPVQRLPKDQQDADVGAVVTNEVSDADADEEKRSDAEHCLADMLQDERHLAPPSIERAYRSEDPTTPIGSDALHVDLQHEQTDLVDRRMDASAQSSAPVSTLPLASGSILLGSRATEISTFARIAMSSSAHEVAVSSKNRQVNETDTVSVWGNLAAGNDRPPNSPDQLSVRVALTSTDTRPHYRFSTRADQALLLEKNALEKTPYEDIFVQFLERETQRATFDARGIPPAQPTLAAKSMSENDTAPAQRLLSLEAPIPKLETSTDTMSNSVPVVANFTELQAIVSQVSMWQTEFRSDLRLDDPVSFAQPTPGHDDPNSYIQPRRLLLSRIAEAFQEQIISILRQPMHKTIHLQLDPAELGRVRISLHSLENGMQVHVVTERPETLDLMRKFSVDLMRDLSQMGFKDLSMSFSDQRQNEERSDSNPQRSNFATTEDAFPIVAVHNVLNMGSREIDIRV